MWTIGIVGATGAVGKEMAYCLFQRSFPMKTLHIYASARSAGKPVTTRFGDMLVEEYTVEKARTCDIIFLAVSSEFALANAKLISENDGPIVIDNSSAFRYLPEIPLVVPEINPEKLRNSSIVANPNCTTAIGAVVLWPLHKKYKIKRIIMSTYQASSGAGQGGMEELLSGTAKLLKKEATPCKVFAHPLAFNVIPHIDEFQENMYTKEEMKVVWETLKIFGETDETMKISCTAVRIPILRAHSESITIETEFPIDLMEAKMILAEASGVRLVDDPLNNSYPMPINATDSFDVEVGRIRKSLVFENGLDIFVCGDQLLRGAALNAVLIAEEMIKESV